MINISHTSIETVFKENKRTIKFQKEVYHDNSKLIINEDNKTVFYVEKSII